MDIYNKFSKVYDKLMYDCDYDKWSQYLLCAIKEGRKGIIRGADLACGSGEITMRLRRGGMDVFGVDISEQMIAEAQKKARANALKINYILGDACQFEPPRKLDFITMCLDGINYIDKNRIHLLFDNAYNNLKDGGIFCFDISTQYKLLEYIGENIFYDDSDDVTYLWTNEVQDDSVTYNIVFFLLEGEKYSRFDESHKLFAYSLQEIKEHAINAGFKEIKVFSERFDSNVENKDMRVHFQCIR